MPKRIQLAFAAITLVAAPAFGADSLHVALRIRPGLWEFTDMPKVTGDTIVADVMLAHVPPAGRAQFVIQARHEMAQTHKARECFTQPKFEQRVSLNFGGCTRSVAANTASALDIRTVCRSEGHGIKEDTAQRISVSGSALVTTTTHAVMTSGAKTMTIDATDIGRWISADCKLGDVIQQLP